MIKYSEALRMWRSTAESKHWGQVDWIVGFPGRPSFVMLGSDEKNGGEVYAVMDVTNGRIVDCDEFPTDGTEETIPLIRE